MLVDLICLADSSKMGGRCIAGLRTDGGGWGRPVAPDTPPGELYQRHTSLDGGRDDPEVLGVIGVDLEHSAPAPGQPERNWIISGQPWELRQRPAAPALVGVLQAAVRTGSEPLGSRTARMSQQRAGAAAASLALIVPERPAWHLRRDVHGRPQVRAVFELSGQGYDRLLTDPAWSSRAARRLLSLKPGRYPNEAIGIPAGNHVLFTVSLSEPHQGSATNWWPGW
jgi:hypothetical protein